MGARASRPSLLRQLLAAGGVFMSVLYLLNLGFGLFELLPDAAPVIGNLDEAGFGMLLLACLRLLRRS
jgi:hypothetical protein